PTNSILFINGDVWGISLLSDNPAKKAPIIASIPAASAKNAPKNTKPKTKIYWDTLSSYFLKNQRPKSGKTRPTISAKIRTDTPSLIQKALVISPVDIPAITASTNKASVSVIMVPPTVILTALFFVIPSLLMMG